MKKFLAISVLVIGVLLVIFLYSPIGSPNLYTSDKYYSSSTYNIKPINNGITVFHKDGMNVVSSTPTNEDISPSQSYNEPMVEMSNSVFGSSNIESLGNISHQNNSYAYENNRKYEQHRENHVFNSDVPITYFGSNHKVESDSKYSSNNYNIETTSTSSPAIDEVNYANGPSKCEPVKCGHNVWVDGYWKYHRGHHKEWVCGYWEWVDEDCNPAVPVGDGTLILILLLIIYIPFKVLHLKK